MDELREIIVGNVCSLCACVTDSVSGTRKKRNQILGIQMISQVFYAAGSIILKGYSSTAQNAVAILRNFAAMKNLKHKFIEWILIALGVVLGVFGIWMNHNAHGWLDWLPIAGNLEYSIAMFRFRENDRALKIATDNAGRIMDGEASVYPTANACTYCPYDAVCRFDRQLGCKTRATEKRTLAELFAEEEERV